MDYFVASIAILAGTILLLAAVANASWLMQLAKVRALTAGIGAAGARLVCGLIGLALIVLGAAVVSGWRPAWAIEKAQNHQPQGEVAGLIYASSFGSRL